MLSRSGTKLPSVCVRWLQKSTPIRIPMHRFYSSGQYNYYQQYNPPPPPRSSFFKRFVYTTVGITIVGGYLYYMFWPKHTFPSSVAKILRKGLWAESDRGEHDYQLALKYYLESLKHYDDIGVDHLSDEYTGIQLKVGEMFERLNMLEDAAFVYNEIATLYLTVLSAQANSEQGKRIKNINHKRHLIQKDLRIAMKLVELNKHNVQLSKSILITHLIIAQDEINKHYKSSSIYNSSRSIQTPNDGKNDNIVNVVLSKDTMTVIGANGEAVFNKAPGIWEPFTDEYFNAMDLLSALSISTGDLTMALQIKIMTIESMLVADVEPSKLLINQCNLGSLLYLQAEEYQAQEIVLKRKISKTLNIDYDKLNNEEIFSKTTKLGNKIIKSTKILPHEKVDLETAVLSKDRCLQLSQESFEGVIQFAKLIPQEVISQNNSINETVALATYGLGVIHLHLSQYDIAERLLRESRVRSKSCGYDHLLIEIEQELEKLFKEKKSLTLLNSSSDEIGQRNIQMDIQLSK
ncbi:hypothetical protein DFJ63DRAFT_262234 [Scheffersomyces coipomensis]|uniref:uncharacterized protein n=1 Tax=Scheffersomyces coipomensis TaxID=1788519 RepID=UPI00315C9383